MSGKKKMLVALLCGLILAATALGLVWHMRHYQLIDMKFYPKDAEILDLRGEEISVSHYEKLSRRLPDTRILWDVPFQKAAWPQDTEKLTVEELDEDDLKVIGYFEKLKTVDARSCTQYELLQQLQGTYPQLQVQYQVTLCGQTYPQDAAAVVADGITGEELALLDYLPGLAEVQVKSAGDAQVMEALRSVCAKRNIAFLVVIGGEGRTSGTEELVLENTTEAELQLLALLPELKSVHISNPAGTAQTLIGLEQELPGVAVSWEKEILGIMVRSDAEEIDLTEGISAEGAKAYEQAKKASILGERDETTWLFKADSDYPLPDKEESTAELIEQVRQAMAYFPKVKTVVMCGAYLDNEAMAAFREEQRQDYKVVWSVRCGGIIARTDTHYFMPTKYRVYYFQDDESENLKYCEDIVSMDLGHMSIKQVEWAAYMPKLEYLVLAHTDVRSIEPLRSCKELKFLEVDWSAVKDFSPLLDCRKLEDLNLGNTYGNFEVIEEMTWLKNLWMVGCSSSAVYKISQALPEVKLMASGSATVANGWRELPNYYAMRDLMNMFYMEW